MTYYLYLLLHPETKEPVYIGCTSIYPSRMRTHKYNFKKDYGFEPIPEILEAYNNVDYAKSREWKLVQQFSRLHHLNQTTNKYKTGRLPNTNPKHKKRIHKKRLLPIPSESV